MSFGGHPDNWSSPRAWPCSIKKTLGWFYLWLHLGQPEWIGKVGEFWWHRKPTTTERHWIPILIEGIKGHSLHIPWGLITKWVTGCWPLATCLVVTEFPSGLNALGVQIPVSSFESSWFCFVLFNVAHFVLRTHCFFKCVGLPNSAKMQDTQINFNLR